MFSLARICLSSEETCKPPIGWRNLALTTMLIWNQSHEKFVQVPQWLAGFPSFYKTHQLYFLHNLSSLNLKGPQVAAHAANIFLIPAMCTARSSLSFNNKSQPIDLLHSSGKKWDRFRTRKKSDAIHPNHRRPLFFSYTFPEDEQQPLKWNSCSFGVFFVGRTATQLLPSLIC